MSVPRTADTGTAVARTSIPSDSDIRAANPSRRCGDRLYTDTRVTGRTLHTARRLVSASSPDPITPTEDESSRLSQRVAAPLVAPVRAAVRNAPSISPRTSPVSSEDTATTYRP